MIYPGPGRSNEQQPYVCESKRKPNHALRDAPGRYVADFRRSSTSTSCNRTLRVFSSSRSPVSHNVGMIQFVACLLTGRK